MQTQINGILITEEQINRESGEVEFGSIDEKRAEATRRLALRELLRQRANALGIDVEGRVDAAIDELIEREIAVPEADETACRRYFEANPERFVTPIEVEIRHILLAAAPDDGPERTLARDKAESLTTELRANGQRFEALATKHSRCPSANEGGRLGVLTRGTTVPELESVILRLPVGLAERPIETRYGFHVVEVLARAGGEPLAYQAVAHLISDYLRERSWRRALSHYLKALITDAQIAGVDLQAEASPLMQ